MKKKALVTGATGFIGNALMKQLLQEGWQVSAIVREHSDLTKIDDIEGSVDLYMYDGSTESVITTLKDSMPDIVFHLASLFLSDHSSEQVTELVHSNILFGTQLLEAMALSNCKRLINTGTSWQHYHTDGYRAVNLYAATKQAFEDILSFYQDRFEMSTITLKLFDTYGPNDTRKKLVNLIAEAVASDYELGLSPGDQVLDISHIDDVTQSFLDAAYSCLSRLEPFRETYFLSGERFTIKQLVREITSVLRKDGKITYGARPYRQREVMTLPNVAGSTPPWDGSSSKKKIGEGILTLLKK